ncbi:MAG: PAS domain S-box protein [Anaerolineae bacterium]|nr:PAS domain S-box protein [Anaerolineae bacterium]
MVHGINLFFALFNNLAIFIALVAVYSYLLTQLKQSTGYQRQIILGLSFGVFAIGCMYAKIPVFEGVIVDQRNAVVALSGAFGGPLSAILSAILAGAFRAYLGGDGVLAGVIGVSLAATAGIGLNIFSGRFNSVRRAAISALLATLVILPGFLFVGDIQTGWELTKAMTLPYGSAIFLAIFLGGLLLRREEERYQVESLFRESEEKYRELVEGTSDLIVHTDKYGNFTFVNHMAETMLGFPPEACIGMSAFEFVHPDDREMTITWFNNCVAQKIKQAKIENRQVNAKTGKSYTVLWSSAFHFDNSGHLVGVGNIARDITESKRLEAQLQQAQKMESIGRLAGGIAHDFNNILVPINLYTEMAMRRLAPDSKLYANMQVIREAAGRAADLTRQILAFSRKQVLEMQVLNLNTIVVEFQKMLQHLIREDIEFQTILDPNLYWINADKGQIEQVLMNLVVNARDAMPTSGKLIIETTNVYLDKAYVEKYAGVETVGHYVMLSVSDTGQGMDAETQQRLFEPFFTTKEWGKGTGLGLSTVFGIIKQHGGHIWVYSELGKGTTFKIYLPRAEESAPSLEAPATTPDSVYGTETILVVEDEAIVRQLVCETLTAHGYKALEAQNIAHALQLASECEGTLHLLLSDVIMPEMNGKELYLKVAAIHPDIAVLYMSGYTDNVIAYHGILDKGVNFLQKPFTVQSLTQKIRQVLG